MHTHMQGGEEKLQEFSNANFDRWRIQKNSQTIMWMVDYQNPYFLVFEILEIFIFRRGMHYIVHHAEPLLCVN